MNAKVIDAVIELVQKKDYVSYVEIEELFDKLGYEWRGFGDIGPSGCPNVVYWSGWNEEATHLISEMLKAGFIDWTPCSPFIYLIDGKLLNLPVVASVEELKKCKTDHWLPRVFTRIKKVE